MNRRQFVLASASACLPCIVSACPGGEMDPPIFYYVDSSLYAYVNPTKKEYSTLEAFLDDQFGKDKWVLSESELEPTRRYVSWGMETRFRDRWKGLGDTAILDRPSGYFGVNPFRLTLEYETPIAEQIEVSYFIEISNPRDRWGIGGRGLQYINAAVLVVDKSVSEPKITLALPLESRVVVAIKKLGHDKMLVAQPIRCTPLVCGGGIPVATQKHADYLNSKVCDGVLPNFRSDHIACTSITK